MTANELRIGNLFDYHGQTVHLMDIKTSGENKPMASFGYFLDSIGFERFLHHEDCPKQIELTPEWLERFGAVFPKEDKMRLQIGELCFYYSGSGGLFLNDSGWNEAISDHQIYYVHELQNLYFSLTSKELTLDK